MKDRNELWRKMLDVTSRVQLVGQGIKLKTFGFFGTTMALKNHRQSTNRPSGESDWSSVSLEETDAST